MLSFCNEFHSVNLTFICIQIVAYDESAISTPPLNRVVTLTMRGYKPHRITKMTFVIVDCLQITFLLEMFTTLIIYSFLCILLS